MPEQTKTAIQKLKVYADGDLGQFRKIMIGAMYDLINKYPDDPQRQVTLCREDIDRARYYMALYDFFEEIAEK